MTDPTPRTAATARDALEFIVEWANDCADDQPAAAFYGFADIRDMARRALAAAEAPGRVAALEAAGMRAARDAHAAWLRAGIGQHTPTLIEECPNEWCREHVAALAAPAPPAGVSGEWTACSCSMTGEWSPCLVHPLGPAPTPSEPVGR